MGDGLTTIRFSKPWLSVKYIYPQVSIYLGQNDVSLWIISATKIHNIFCISISLKEVITRHPTNVYLRNDRWSNGTSAWGISPQCSCSRWIHSATANGILQEVPWVCNHLDSPSPASNSHDRVGIPSSVPTPHLSIVMELSPQRGNIGNIGIHSRWGHVDQFLPPVLIQKPYIIRHPLIPLRFNGPGFHVWIQGDHPQLPWQSWSPIFHAIQNALGKWIGQASQKFLAESMFPALTFEDGTHSRA